jgi:PAS domain S-box-containing protein
MKLFWKIFVSVFITTSLIFFILSYFLTVTEMHNEEGNLIDKNRIVSDLMSKQIERYYLEYKWPLESLSRLSKDENFLFWWVVRDDNTIHLADKTSFVGTSAYSYFPLMKTTGEVFLNHKEKYGIIIKPVTIENKEWYFWLGFSTKQLYGRMRDITLSIALVSGLALALLAIVLYSTIRHFLLPVKDLNIGVTAIGKGDLNYRIRVKSGDEIGELGRSFNKMVEDLQKITVSRDELAKEVQERKKTEEELKQQKGFIQKALDSFRAPFYVVNLDYTIALANEAAKEKGIFEGGYCYQCTHRQQNSCDEKDPCPLREVLRTGKVAKMEHIHYDKDGNKSVAELYGYPLFNKDGQIVQMIEINYDITDRKKVEAELKRLASFPDLNPNPIVEIDFSGSICYLNPAAKQMMPDLQDAGLKHLFLKDLESISSIFEQEGKEAFVREIKIGDIWFQQLFSCLPKIQRIRIYASDLTERKKAEEELRTSENKYRTLLENLPQRIFHKDRNSVYVSCNDSYAQDLKIKPEEITGKTDFEFYPKKLAEKYRADDKRVMDSVKIEEIEEQYIQEGREYVIHTVKTPIKDEQGNVTGILGIFRDITERKRADEAFKEYTKKIEQINKELDDFTYIVSHDLKEPLRSIDAFSKFLDDDYRDKIDEEGRGYIHRIRANSLRMQNLIEDLLEISRIEKKRSPYEESRASDIIEDARLHLEFSLKEKNVQLIIQDNLPKFFCDRLRMVEVFANLFSNAIKFNDKPQPTIEVSYAEKEDAHEFCVKDNGPGIEEQYFNKIFEIFQRLGNREAHEGTGAGLTIIKKIIEMHKGKIWVDSKVGEYTAFYFTIPKRKQGILGKKKIGEILVEKKLVTEEEVKKALDEQEGRG